MKRKILILGSAMLLIVSISAAQRRGGNSGMGAGQQGQHGAPAQMGQRQQMGGAMGTRDQQGLRIHASDQQRKQLRDCSQSADRIRKRTRDMSRQSGAALAPEQAKQWRAQLRNEVQAMNQQQEQLMAGLSEEQKAASRQTIQQMEQSRTQLRDLAEALDNELIAPELQQDRIREHARDTEHAAAQLKKHQNQLAAELNQ